MPLINTLRKKMEKITLKNQSGRIVWLDFLKVIAIFMMLAVHCTDNVTPAERSEPWYNMWGSFYGSFMRPAIPLFVMVTGALLLPVKADMGTFYKKRLMRLVIPFLMWSVVYNLFPWVTGLLGLPAGIINAFFAWAEPSQQFADAWHNICMIPFRFSWFAVQMWYVYLLIGLYLYLPFFSAWVRQSTLKEQHIFLSLWFVSLFIPYLREYLTKDLWGVCSWNEFGMLYYFAGFNGYLLLGHYLASRPLQWSWGKTLGIGGTLFLIGYCITFFGFKNITAVPGQPESLVELFYTYCSPNVLFMSLPLFIIVQKIQFRSPILCNSIVRISTCTFGIWMSHYLFLGPCNMLVSQLEMHTMLRMLVCSVLLLGVTWAFVYVVLKLGKVGKWIMG